MLCSNAMLELLTPSDHWCIHTYYDVCPDSPDGDRIVYTRFEAEPPGPATVVVARADGREPRDVARAARALGHGGASPQWVDEHRLAFTPGDTETPCTEVLDLRRGARQRLPGHLRSMHPSGMGLIERDPCTLDLWDATTDQRRTLITTRQLYERHPSARDPDQVDAFRIVNAKWARDGQRTMLVFTNGTHGVAPSSTAPRAFGDGVRIVEPEAFARSVKALFAVTDATGELTYLGEFTHHPHWSPDGTFVYGFDRRWETDTQDLVAYHLDGTRRVLLADVPGGHPHLHPDGRTLLVDAHDWNDADTATLLAIDLPAGRRRELFTCAQPRRDHVRGYHMHPAWSRDGACFFVNACFENQPGLYRGVTADLMNL